MNDNIVYMGVNAPRIHQAIIAQLVTGLMNLYRNRQTQLFAYPEAMIDQSQTSPVPDLLLANPETELTEVLIEVTHTQGVKKDTQKLKELMTTYDVPEGFVYDYKLNIWHRYELDGPDSGEESSFCQAVGHSLNEFLF
ncbi:hypothetical protein EXU85_17965 [Spirosoma sp. KCTC 42546]|uniref:Uma2 family endonuclease n=1 Tax=Spirosoma sp. KCTC 42546 TaxID=2520506 RepID=UPI00115AC1D6|nr:Uma2 family endonuclease [Spirosoma sp. KCTC 42546]QDK80387.1 hypothetical protein EXU85_17965 [Spirosoma sp. KCTC 42546]